MIAIRPAVVAVLPSFAILCLALLSPHHAHAQGTDLIAGRGDTMPAAVVQRFVDAANARDARTMGALVAPDAVFARFPDGRVVLTGRDSIEAHYARRLPAAPAGFRITVNPRIVEGSIVVDQEHIAGRPGGPAVATWMYEVRGGLIRKAWVIDGR